MTHAHESVYLRFRGRMRRLPLVSLATALRRDLDEAAHALETLILGPPEIRAASAIPDTTTPVAVSATPRGEGDIGGGVHEQAQTNLSCERKQEHGDGGAGEGAEHARVVDALVANLGSDANRLALERLVSAHPRPLLDEALRRTLRVPPERIRSSRSAIFTGIVRKLAAHGLDFTP